ncbi:SMI1/KNR4 family protein [Pseudomonas sp. JAI120]|uniref:SMI1/KNR4 family protein n=1 Tax=Pseudomonas sp. JAI120 TaxID=2723063 RepID=UPI0030DAFD55
MINDLGGLIKYSEKIAARFSVIASEIKLCSPGYSKNYLSSLREDGQHFPDDYLVLLERVQVLGVSIGQLNLWPVPYGRRELSSVLIEANRSPENPWLTFYNDNEIVEVARWEANIICLGRKDSSNNGKVYFLDISSGHKLSLRPMADSFEQLIIVASNLHEVSIDYEEEPESGVQAFSLRLVTLGIKADSSALWLELLNEALY